MNQSGQFYTKGTQAVYLPKSIWHNKSKSPRDDNKFSDTINTYLIKPPMKLPYQLTKNYYVKRDSKQGNLSARSYNSQREESDDLYQSKSHLKSQLSKLMNQNTNSKAKIKVTIKDLNESYSKQRRSLMKVLETISTGNKKLSVKTIQNVKPILSESDSKVRNTNKTQSPQKSVKFPLIELQFDDDQFFKYIKHYQTTIFHNQCANLFYIRPSSMRQQIYYLQEPNPQFMKKIMLKRWWWTETFEMNEEVLFLWSFSVNNQFIQKQRIRIQSGVVDDQRMLEYFNLSFDQVEDPLQYALSHRLTMLLPCSKVHNHMQYNNLFHYKKNLLRSLKIYYDLLHGDVFNTIPYSVHISSLADPQLGIFLKKYKNSNDMWIVKPAEMSLKGTCIRICYNTRQILDHIQQQLNIPNKAYRTFLIQRYVKPFLYQKRKMDIRCFVLVSCINGIIKAYFYEDGYGSTSSYEYKQDESDLLHHVTNYYLQKNSTQFGVHEIGNKVSFQKIHNYLIQFGQDFNGEIMLKLRDIALDVIRSGYYHLMVKDHNFQILQLDYLLDDNFKVWLMEINTDLNMEFSCQFVSRLQSQLLEDTLKLTLDILYPPPALWPKNKRKYLMDYEEKNKFQLIFDSRTDSINLLELYKNVDRLLLNDN